MSDLRARLLNIIYEIYIISEALQNKRTRNPPCCLEIKSNKISCSYLKNLPPEEFYKECLVCLNEIKETINKLKRVLSIRSMGKYE